jgi:hypothetical protein
MKVGQLEESQPDRATGRNPSMLILTVRNVFTDEHDIADYHFQLYINLERIAAGSVLEHQRKDGAAALLRRVADEMESWPKEGLDLRVGGEGENTDTKEPKS